MPPLSHADLRTLLTQQLAAAEEELQDLPVDESAGAKGDVSVVIGSSALAAKMPGLADRLTAIIVGAYEAAGSEGPRMLDMQPVSERLAFGDRRASRSNRVLHVALRGGEAVGCISSSFHTLWTEVGIGHWGLLAVDVAAQGTGVGSALVAAAERRIAEECQLVHIEYDFTPGDPHTERLRAWYEARSYRRLGGRRSPGPPGSEFCFCRRPLSEEELRHGRARRLRAERDHLAAELAALDDAGGEVEEVALRSRSLFDALRRLVRERGGELMGRVNAVFQLVVLDSGDAGKFVLDLKRGGGDAREGEDAEADCTVSLTDDDFVGWAEQTLDGIDLFWTGRLKVRGDGALVQALFPLFGAAMASRS